MSTTCTFNSQTSIYEYLTPSDQVLTQGKLINITLLNDQGTFPLCIFNSTHCKRTEIAKASTTGEWIPTMVTFCIGYVIATYVLKVKGQQLFGYTGDISLGAILSKATPTTTTTTAKSTRPKCTPHCCKRTLFFLLYVGCIVAMIAEATIMPSSIQDNLPPADRSAQMAMESFLAPVKEIFAFLEDTMTVKVGYAVAALNYSELNALLHIGIAGGVISGVIAFLTMLVVAYYSPLATAVLNPSHATNQIVIDNGCSLLPTTDQLLEHARVYWILITASWIPKFATKAVVGFLIGTGNLLPFLFSSIVQATVPISIWYVFKTDTTGLSVLGFAYGISDWILGITFLGYFCCHTSLREEYGLHLLWCGGGGGDRKNTANHDHDNDAGTADATTTTTTTTAVFKDVVQGGLQLMAVDLAVQLSITITIYTATSQHLSVGYKLAAAQAAYWSFGPQYLMPINMILKIVGSRLMGSGHARKYAGYFMYGAILTFALACGAVWLGFAMGSNLAYDFGENACVYAGQEQCAEIYANVFLGPDSLSNLFSTVFGPTVSMQLLFAFLRCALATCHDFDFLAKASWVCFIFGFIPSILVARFWTNTASSYFIAMYVPHVLMIVVFAKRMHYHLQCMLNDLPGPWSTHMETLKRKRSESISAGGGLGCVAITSKESDGLLLSDGLLNNAH